MGRRRFEGGLAEGMTRQAKQTEQRCEAIPGAGQRQIRMIGERAARTGRNGGDKTQVQRGGKRVKDGREGRRKAGRQEEHTPTQVCSLLSAG